MLLVRANASGVALRCRNLRTQRDGVTTCRQNPDTLFLLSVLSLDDVRNATHAIVQDQAMHRRQLRGLDRCSTGAMRKALVQLAAAFVCVPCKPFLATGGRSAPLTAAALKQLILGDGYSP